MLIKKIILLSFLFVCFTGCFKFKNEDSPEIEAKQLTNCGEIWYLSFLSDFCGIPSENYLEDESSLTCSLEFRDLESSWSYSDYIRILLFESSSVELAENYYYTLREFSSTDPNYKPLLDIGDDSYSIYTPNGSNSPSMEVRFLKGAVDGSILIWDMDCFSENDANVLARRLADNIPE